MARAIFLMLVLLLPAPVQAADRLEIALCDDVHLRRALLARAEFIVEYLLNRANVWVSWTGCALDTAPVIPRLVIRIRSALATRDQRLVLGQSFCVRGNWSYGEVYFGSVREYVNSEGVPVNSGEMLGYAMVHEIGHLLGNPHSRRGIMAAEFGRTERDALGQLRLRFTKAESSVIVEELRRRMVLETTSQITQRGSERIPR